MKYFSFPFLRQSACLLMTLGAVMACQKGGSSPADPTGDGGTMTGRGGGDQPMGDGDGDGDSGVVSGDGGSTGTGAGTGDGDGDGDTFVGLGGTGPITNLPGAPLCEEEVCADIRARRTSGVAPLAVMFDATVDKPGEEAFHAFNYAWDFRTGDDYDATWKYTDLPKKYGYGPIAAHVYETPGIYEVTLTVTDAAGNEATDTVEIRVLSQDSLERTLCYANITSGGGNFEGCPLDTNGDGLCDKEGCVDTDVFPGNNSATPNTRLLFRRGDTFHVPSETITKFDRPGPGVITAFGPGVERPIIAFESDSGKFGFDGGSKDWRIHGLHMLSSGSQQPFAAGEDTLYYDMIVEGFDGCMVAQADPGDPMVRGLFLVDYECLNLQNGKGWKIYLIAEETAVMGAHINTGKVAEGNFRVMHGGKMLLQNSFFDYFPEKKQSISIRSCDAFDNTMFGGCEVNMPTFQLIISDNRLTADSNWVLNFEHKGPFSDVIFERNFMVFNDAPADNSLAFFVFGGALDRATVRNNIGFTDSGIDGRLVRSDAKKVWVYGNTLVTTATGESSACHGNSSTGECANNLVWSNAPNTHVNDANLPGEGNMDQNSLTSFPFQGALKDLPTIDEFRLKTGSEPYTGAAPTEHANSVDFYTNARKPGGSIGAIEHN